MQQGNPIPPPPSAPAPPPPGSASAAMTPEQRVARNKVLIGKMLDLETPEITDKMLSFLLQDGVAETLVSFISQVIDDSETESQAAVNADSSAASVVAPSSPVRALRSRPRRGDEVTTELKRSYSAAQLLACAAPTGASIEFMSTKASVVLSGVFRAFEANSAACVEHACRVLSHIADEDMDLVVAVVTESSASFERCFGGLFNEIHDAAAFSTLLALLENDDLSAAARWQMVDKLAEWPLLLKVATHVFESGHTVEHVEASADFFLALLDNLATDSSSGERLLQPLTHCPELLHGFLSALDADDDDSPSTATNGESSSPSKGNSGSTSTTATGTSNALPYEQRLACARCLLGLLRRCDKPEVPPRPPPNASPQMLAAAAAAAAVGTGPTVENLLHVHKAAVHSAVGGERGLTAFAKVLASGAVGLAQLAATSPAKLAYLPPLLGMPAPAPSFSSARSSNGTGNSGQGDGSGSEAFVRHPGRYGAPPLSELRLCVATIVAELVTTEPAKHFDVFPKHLWRTLASLFFCYPHSDLYHCQVYRIFWAALHHNHEPSLKQLLQTGRFLHHLVVHTTAPNPTATSSTNRSPTTSPAHSVTNAAKIFSPKKENTEPGISSAAAASGSGSGFPSPVSPSTPSSSGVGNSSSSGSSPSPLVLAMTAHTGHALALGSALRLQCALLPPSAWLRSFLQSHATWRAFLPLLERTTLLQQRGRGMGFRVPGDPPAKKKVVNKPNPSSASSPSSKAKKAPGENYNPLMGFSGFNSDDDSDDDEEILLANSDDDKDDSAQAQEDFSDTSLIDLGSRLAKSLGFENDPIEIGANLSGQAPGAASTACGGVAGSPNSESGRKKKGKVSAKKKKKRRSKELRESFSAPGFDVGANEVDTEEGSTEKKEADNGKGMEGVGDWK